MVRMIMMHVIMMMFMDVMMMRCECMFEAFIGDVKNPWVFAPRRVKTPPPDPPQMAVTPCFATGFKITFKGHCRCQKKCGPASIFSPR